MNRHVCSVTRLLALLLLFGAVHSALAQEYVITDLGKLGGTVSQAVGISAEGYAAGWSETNQSGSNGNLIKKPFIWYRGRLTQLPGLAPGRGATAASYAKPPNPGNPFGTQYVTGDAENSTGATRAYLYRSALWPTMTDLGTLANTTESHGTGVNNQGQVVGWASGAGIQKAFFYTGGVMWDISGGSNSIAYGINDAGQAVGHFSQTVPYFPGFVIHAFRYDRSSGQRTDLGSVAGYPHSYGLAINQSGQVAGYVSTVFQPGSYRGFVYGNGTFQLIGTMNNIARALNSSGQVVGTFKTATGQDRAYIFQNNQMTDLNTLIPATSGWIVKVANAINDAGQIVGYGTIGGETHAFLMTPIPATYAVTEIPLKPSTVVPNSLRINNRGQVVGASAQGHAAVWTAATNVVTELTNVLSHAYDINEWGEIAGESGGRAFYYGGGPLVDLGTLGGLSSDAFGINNTSPATIVGKSPAAVDDRAFMTTRNSLSMTALPLPGGAYSHSAASAVNDFNQVVGEAKGAFGNGMSFSTAFLWTPSGGSIGLPSPGNTARAWDINNAGQAVGESQVPNQLYDHAALWAKDGNGQWWMLDLSAGSPRPSRAVAINNLGQVAGTANTASGVRASLWNNGVITDLNSKIPPNPGFVLTLAVDINDYGQIICIGRTLGPQPQQRVYLLSR